MIDSSCMMKNDLYQTVVYSSTDKELFWLEVEAVDEDRIAVQDGLRQHI